MKQEDTAVTVGFIGPDLSVSSGGAFGAWSAKVEIPS